MVVGSIVYGNPDATQMSRIPVTKASEADASHEELKDSATPYPSPVYAWFVLALLVLGSLVAFVDRQVVAIVVEPMKEDLGVGDTQIGWLYGVFALFYAVAALPIAGIADRGSRTKLIAVGIFLWSFMTIACGLSRQYWLLFIARMGVGIGEATLTPATTSLVGDYFPRDKIPLALSVFQTGAIFGTGFAFLIGGVVLGYVEDAAPLVLPIVGELRPWQQTFAYVGLPGFILAMIFWVLREPARRADPSKPHLETTNASNKLLSAELVAFYKTHKTTLILHHLGFLSLVLMGYAFVFWTVTYFVRIHGMAPSEASQAFGWIYLIAGPIGPIAVALAAKKLRARGHLDANIIAGMVGGLLVIPVIVLIQFAPSANVALLLYIPAVILVNSPFGIAAAALPMIAPPHLRARVAAVYMLTGSVGMLFGPPLAGFFNEFVFPEQDGLRYSMVTLTTLFGVLGGILLQLARPHYARSLALAE